MINESIRNKNTELAEAFYLDGRPNRVLIYTMKIDRKSKIGPIKIISSYCPFCGKPYEDKNEQANGDN